MINFQQLEFKTKRITSTVKSQAQGLVLLQAQYMKYLVLPFVNFFIN